MVYEDHAAVLQYYNYSVLNVHRPSSSSNSHSLLKIVVSMEKKVLFKTPNRYVHSVL